MADETYTNFFEIVSNFIIFRICQNKSQTKILHVTRSGGFITRWSGICELFEVYVNVISLYFN